MKRLLTLVTCFLLTFSVVRAANDKDTLTLKGFVNALSTFEFDVTEFTDALGNVTVYAEANQPESFPSIADNFQNVDGLESFFDAVGNMFKDIGKCILLIGEWIIYLVKMLVVAIVIPLFKLLICVLNMVFDILLIFLSLLGFSTPNLVA